MTGEPPAAVIATPSPAPAPTTAAPQSTSPMPRLDCASLSEALAETAGGDRGHDSQEVAHLESCLRCRVEQSRYRHLMQALSRLRDTPVPTDPRLESQILVYLDRHGTRWAWDARPRLAAKVAAGAAAAAGLIAFTARHRRIAKLAS
ncbi:MAG: hypothetical protein OXC58_03205 [Acidimicrobiaceae bacterium]|nr:hypothetical protein [Acidimicrobiaceae bacterium]